MQRPTLMTNPNPHRNTNPNPARLPYWYYSKNVSGDRRHSRSVVAYSAEVVHRAVLIHSPNPSQVGCCMVLDVCCKYKMLKQTFTSLFFKAMWNTFTVLLRVCHGPMWNFCPKN